MIHLDNDPFNGCSLEELTRETYRAAHARRSLIRLFERIQSDFESFLSDQGLTGLAFLGYTGYSYGSKRLKITYYVAQPDGDHQSLELEAMLPDWNAFREEWFTRLE